MIRATRLILLVGCISLSWVEWMTKENLEQEKYYVDAKVRGVFARLLAQDLPVS